MFQIIINHSGLSIGETQVITNLFADYIIYENIIDNDFEYASILEIEFIKGKKISFFDFVSIEKWTFLIEIIKNIKKRRGKKGLRFKIIITDDGKFDHHDQEPDVFNKTVFILNHKNDLDFIKGLERIEISIENIVEIYEFQKLKEEQLTQNKFPKDKIQNNQENTMFFVFNESSRKWIRFINKTHIEKNEKEI